MVQLLALFTGPDPEDEQKKVKADQTTEPHTVAGDTKLGDNEPLVNPKTEKDKEDPIDTGLEPPPQDEDDGDM